MLPHSSLLIIYMSFIRPHLYYGVTVYDQPNNSALSHKIGSLQHNVVLAKTNAIRFSSNEKLYHELGFESFKDRKRMRKICDLY